MVDMASAIQLPRTLLIYAITIPLALVLGYLLTSVEVISSFAALVLVVLVLLMPILIRSHHAILLFAWSAALGLSFFPGSPALWMLMVVLSLGFTILNRILDRESTWNNIPAVTWSLVLLGLVVLVTAKLRGGITLATVSGGANVGGKAYFTLFLAILGYFALSAVSIPLGRVKRSIKLFYLSGLTAPVPHLILIAGPALYFLFVIFPPTTASMQYMAELEGSPVVRYGGIAVGCEAVIHYLLARYGIRDLLSIGQPLLTLTFLIAVILAPLGGFRSALGGIAILFTVQFFLEGLHRTKFLPLLLAGTVLGGLALIPLAPILPGAAQRALSFLPINIDAQTRSEAEASSDWRFDMWHDLLPELHNYVLVGKGYQINLSDVYLAEESIRRGLGRSYEPGMLAGNYHNGPLSVYIPFGSVGLLAFLLFWVAALRTLYHNYRYGEPALRRINTFLLASFISEMIIFTFIFGALSSQFCVFTGTVGLGVALNHGVRTPSQTRKSRPLQTRANPAFRTMA